MYKELIILGVIVASIIGLEIITQNYTQNVINQMNAELSELKDEIKLNPIDNEKIFSKAKSVYEDLMGYHDTLALYIDHIELEKVETSLVSCKSFIESAEYNEATTELEKTSFTLEHIGQKYAFNLANIF